MLQQKGVGSFARQHEARKEEHMWAAGELESGKRFVKVMPILWVYGAKKDAVSESLVRAKRLWEDCGYRMQEDRGILPIMFISSLPLGLYNVGKNVDNLERSFVAPASTVAVLLPVQADFAGGGAPYLLLAGRKGQLCTLDLFDSHANNHNAFVAASTGSGKSFFVNCLTYNYFGAGAKITDHRHRRQLQEDDAGLRRPLPRLHGRYVHQPLHPHRRSPVRPTRHRPGGRPDVLFHLREATADRDRDASSHGRGHVGAQDL